MLNLKKLQTEISEFLESSGDYTHYAVNYGKVIGFTHIALTEINFSADVLIEENGEIQINIKELNESALNEKKPNDVTSLPYLTLLKVKVVKKGNVSNIKEVIDFIMSWKGEELQKKPKMREIIGIEMATHNDIYEVTFGSYIEVAALSGGFAILKDGHEADWFESKRDAEDEALDYLIDEMLIITGHGKNSGKKFWQLPENLQNHIEQMASEQAKKRGSL